MAAERVGQGEPRTRIARFSTRKRGPRRTVSGMQRTITAVALGLTACVAPTQPGPSDYKDARFAQADGLNCREQASAAATHAYEIFGYRGHDDVAMGAYKSAFDRCVLGH